MTKQTKIIAIVAGVVIISLSVFIGTIIGGGGRKKTYFKEFMQAKDNELKAVQGERDAYKLDADNSRTFLAQKRVDDSTTLASFYKSQQLFQQTINAQLKNIPVNIARIAHDDDAIRRAFSTD